MTIVHSRECCPVSIVQSLFLLSILVRQKPDDIPATFTAVIRQLVENLWVDWKYNVVFLK